MGGPPIKREEREAGVTLEGCRPGEGDCANRTKMKRNSHGRGLGVQGRKQTGGRRFKILLQGKLLHIEWIKTKVLLYTIGTTFNIL